MKIREFNRNKDAACRLCNRSVKIRRLSGESSAHNDLAVDAVNAARSLDQFSNAYAYRHVHEYVRLIAAVNFAADSQVLRDTRLLLVNRLRNLCCRLKIDNNRLCRRRKLHSCKIHAQTLSHYRTLLTHRVDIRQEMNGNCILTRNPFP